MNNEQDISALSKDDTSVTVVVADVFADDSESVFAGDERLGFHDVPYRAFVNVLGFPSTIGTAIAASAAFSVLASSSILGDSSPEAFAMLRRMVTLLTYSIGSYAIATTITCCLQFLYTNPWYCKVMAQKINLTIERRKEIQPHNTLRYVLVYGSVGMAYMALILQYVGTILLLEVFSPFGPVLVAQIGITLASVFSLFAFATSVALERRDAWDRWQRILEWPFCFKKWVALY